MAHIAAIGPAVTDLGINSTSRRPEGSLGTGSAGERTAHEKLVICPLLRLGAQGWVEVGIVRAGNGFGVGAHAVEIRDGLVRGKTQRRQSLRGSRGAAALLAQINSL
jgi:hypothetical protein